MSETKCAETSPRSNATERSSAIKFDLPYNRILLQVQRIFSDGVFRTIVGGGLASFTVNVIGLSLGFLIHAMISRSLGAQAYGSYAMWISLSLLLVMPAKFGMDIVALRFSSLYMAEQRFGALGSLSGFAVRTLILSNFAVGAFAALVCFALPERTLFVTPIAWLLLIVLVLELSFLGVFSAFFRASRLIFESQAYDKLVRPILTSGMIAALLLLGFQLTLERALYITAAASGLALLALALRFRLIFASKWRGAARDASDRSQWLKLGWPILMITAVQQLIAQSPLLLLGSLAGSEDAGLYAAAARLAAFVSFGLAALNAISAPMIASAHARRDTSELRRIAAVNARIALLAAGAVSITLILFGPSLLGLFGVQFVNAYPSLLILLLGGLINAGTGSVGYFMTMTGNQIAALAIFLLALTLSVALAAILIPAYGLAGAAISGAVGVSLVNLAQYLFVLIKIGVDTSALGLCVTQKFDR